MSAQLRILDIPTLFRQHGRIGTMERWWLDVGNRL
jgi:hypothetical protein